MTGHQNELQQYSVENYVRLMELLLSEGYSTQPFTIREPTGKTVFLRHDIDYSVPWAEEFSRINEEYGVRGTFFFQLRSRLYNPFSFEFIERVEKIVSRGQYVAFHLVVGEEYRDYEDIYNLLKNDFWIFKSIVKICQPVFAWHNPSLHLSGRDQLLKGDFPGFVNVYGNFAGGEYPFYSDSNMRYSLRELEAIFRKKEEVFQLALAPMQWLPGKKDMKAVMAANLVQKVRELQVEFLDNYVFKDSFPSGIPEIVLDALEGNIMGS